MLAVADPQILAGVVKTTGWVILIAVVVFGACAGLAAVGLLKILTAPLRWIFRRGSHQDRDQDQGQ